MSRFVRSESCRFFLGERVEISRDADLALDGAGDARRVFIDLILVFTFDHDPGQLLRS